MPTKLKKIKIICKNILLDAIKGELTSKIQLWLKMKLM